MGNRTNPLVTYRSVAADQKHHRYGSRIFAPVLVGFTPPGYDKPHDGYLWVADSGGGIKGSMRFDLFVGKQEVYEFVMELEKQKGRWPVPIEIERLPTAPKGYSPQSTTGLRKILKGVALLEGESEKQVTAALTAFQRKHKHIPESEYGASNGAISLWYLTQAALKLSKGEKYDAEAAGSHASAEAGSK
jgi:3D (Asp-Asp-Asp) domain-containing protein